MVNSKELTIGAWVKSSKDIAQVTALYKEEDGIHVKAYVPRALAAKRELE